MSNFSEAVRQMLEEDAICPNCGEQNVRGQKSLITVDEQYRASCDRCGRSFVAERRREPREGPR